MRSLHWNGYPYAVQYLHFRSFLDLDVQLNSLDITPSLGLPCTQGKVHLIYLAAVQFESRKLMCSYQGRKVSK